MKFHEDGSFDITLLTTDFEKVELRCVANWLFYRLSEFTAHEVGDVHFHDDRVELSTSYHDRYGDYRQEHFSIPSAIFFSEASANTWLKEEKARKEAEKQRQKELERQNAEKAREMSERAELRRLQEKYK